MFVYFTLYTGKANSDYGFTKDKLRKVKNLTTNFILVNSIAQLFYLILVAPCEISYMVTREWIFGTLACKVFKSWKAVAAGIFFCN